MTVLSFEYFLPVFILYPHITLLMVIIILVHVCRYIYIFLQLFYFENLQTYRKDDRIVQ